VLLTRFSCTGAARDLLPALEWHLPADKPITVRCRSVKHATDLQLEPVVVQRRQRFACFLSQALTSPPADADFVQLSGVLSTVWSKTRWSNWHKETYWRLVFDALPTPQRLHVNESCPCGVSLPGRTHQYWDCPAAQAVVAAMQSAIPHHTITRQHLWLMVSPGGVFAGVWYVVCLAAIHAMRHAAGTLCSPTSRQRWLQSPQLHVQHASAVGVDAFWDYSYDLTMLGGVSL